MRRIPGSLVGVVAAWLLAGPAAGAPARERVEIASPDVEGEGLVGDIENPGAVAEALGDTTWIADWSFDLPGGGCTDAGWVRYDNRILNDGTHYWVVDNRFDATGGITGKAAILSKHDPCWARDGYGNKADYAVVCRYSGATATISFDFLSDSEPGYDYVTIESDSLGLSEARVDYAVDPEATPESFRSVLFSTDGPNTSSVVALALPDLGSGTHEVYIRLESDGAYSDEDGNYPTAIHAGLVVDNLAIAGGTAYSEDFEASLNANVQLLNAAPATPFGQWARLYKHVSDNDRCTENTTCAWLWSDPKTAARFPDMAFGPEGAVVHNWLDEILVSPWVSLGSTAGASGTALSFRRFDGQRFSQSKIQDRWRVRAKVRVDDTRTPQPGDSLDCVRPWSNAPSFDVLSRFLWGTSRLDISPYFDPTATEIQVCFRIGDWQLIAGDGPPVTLNPGPGPYIDRVRIGRRVLTGPVIVVGIDTRTQAQDCFPTVPHVFTGGGEHFQPDGSNRFGTCAFSEGTELGLNSPGNALIITGDSIQLHDVADARGAGGITSVRWYGAIVEGPHAGLAPAPYTVGGNGYFQVTADSCRTSGGAVIRGCYFVDVDDLYFRGGDALKYYWQATDAGGGVTSSPGGIGGTPASVAAAEVATGGLYEVTYLPTVAWDPAYLARLQAVDPGHGDVEPTPEEIAASSQQNCLLYYQHTTSNRRSGPTNRTAFMYTLDRLGYRGHYDIYDVQGYGNTNNQLGGRANVAQASGYALIIEDDGRSNLTPNIPDGSSPDNWKVDQAQWYRDYLDQGLTGLVGTATVWVIGENTAFEKASNSLFTTYMGLTGIADNQGLSVNPDVVGGTSFTFENGCVRDFTSDRFSLNGGCPSYRAYDATNATGTAVVTHRYRAGTTTGGGAIVMNMNAALHWNTVWQGFPWFDIRSASGGAPTPALPDEEEVLAGKILACVLPLGCRQELDPTGGEDPALDAPRVTALHQNIPNPFNPTTTIGFGLAAGGQVELRIFDVAGRFVRILVDGRLPAGRHQVTWNGLDETGERAPSGIYFCRLEAGRVTATRKLVVMK